MDGEGKIRTVEFAEPAPRTGIRIFYDRQAALAFLKNIGRTKGNTDTATLAPVFKYFLDEKFLPLLFQVLFCFPVIVRWICGFGCWRGFCFSSGH